MTLKYVRRQDNGDCDNEHEGREAHHHVGKTAEQHVHATAEIPGESSQDDADGDIDTDGDEANRERDPGAIYKARPDIASQRVGAQYMSRRGRLPHHGQVDAVGIVERYNGRKNGEQGKEGQGCHADNGQTVAAKAAQEAILRLRQGMQCVRRNLRRDWLPRLACPVCRSGCGIGHATHLTHSGSWGRPRHR